MRARDEIAFTLTELVMVILLVAILAVLSVSIVGTDLDAQKYETTRERLEKIRTAIFGDNFVDNEGHRKNFGFHGDWGSMPSTLDALVSSQTPAWSFHSTYGFGTGWRGPYVPSEFTASLPITKDGWGRDFNYSPASNPPTLTSYGSDGVAGGSVHAKDLTMIFPINFRQSRVHGFVLDGDTRLSAKTVEIRYPVNGSITAFTTTTNANGYFSLSNVPFGIRSLQVTDSPTLGPKNIVVDQAELEVPTSMFNYFGSVQAVTYVVGSAATSGVGQTIVNATLNSTYVSSVTIDFVTVRWTPSDGYLTQMVLNGVSQGISNVTAGTRIDITVAQTLPANTNNNTLDLYFASNPDGTGNINMKNHTLHLEFEWTSVADKDTVTFTTP